MNLVSAAERFSSMDRSAITLDIHRCLHSYDRLAACEACFDVCPSSAIQPGKPPVLESGKCVTCLACIPACPVGAFAADDAMKELLSCVARLETTSIELLCELNPFNEQGCGNENTGIRIRGCLAGLGAGSLMILVAMGLDQIFVRMDACADCVWGKVKGRIEEHVSEAQALLGAWGKQNTLAIISKLENPIQRPIWNAHNPPLSRRDLFRFASRQGQVALGRALDQTPSGSNHKSGRNRRRIISAVEHLTPLKAEYDPILAAKTYATLTVSDACTACGVCARACPTNAVRFTTDAEETTFQLTFLPQLCIGCELCAHICVPSAISVDQAPTFRQWFSSENSTLLLEGALDHCEVCKAVFVADPTKHLCPSCDFRRTNPFGYKIPPSVKITGDPLSGKRQP